MSQLVKRQKRLTPVIRSAEAPNLDPKFWDTSSATGVTVDDVLSKPYLYQVWVYSCATTIINNLAPLPKILVNSEGQIIKDHPTAQLFRRPNSMMTIQQFNRYLFSLLLLPSDSGNGSGGQCFIIPWNTKQDQKVDLRREIPTELYVYPDKFFTAKMKDIGNGRNVFEAWEFRIQPAVTPVTFYPYEIIRINRTNPYDILKGIPPTVSIATAMELDTNSDIYNRNVFENDGRLSGQVTTDQYLDDKQLEQNKKEWNKQYTGMKRRMTAFLTGGMKYEQFALSQSDMQYMEQAKWIRQKIIAAYGLNRIALGDYEEINYATIREGRKMLWQDTYIPLDKLVLDAINNQWLNYLSDTVILASDYSKVPALQSDLGERIKSGALLCTQMNFPPELAARIVEIPLTKDDLKRWPYLSDPIKSSEQTPQITAEPKSIKVKSIEAREEFVTDYIKRVLDPSERAFKRDLDKFFISQRNEILDRVDAWFAGKKSIQKAGDIHAWLFLFEVLKENYKLYTIYRANAKDQAEAEVDQIERELKHGINWSVTEPRLDYWAEKRKKYLDEINTATFNHARDAIGETVKQGTADGLTPAEMSKKIKEAVQDVYDVRLGKPVTAHGKFDLGGMSSSKTIARTEMGVIASMTRYEAFQSEGIEKIEWVTSHDDDVRKSHKSLDTNTVKLGEEFKNGLRFPRDENGPPEEVINCRCAYIAVMED